MSRHSSSRHSSRAPELSQFELDIINDHSAAEPDASNFEVKWETIDMGCNCIAYAVGATDQWMNPFTIAELTQQYNEHRYFEIPTSSSLRRGDVEVYLHGSEPKHAHKIVSTSGGGRAKSKMGNGPVIEHPRRMLDSDMRQRPGHYRYGRIAMRFRRDDRQYEAWYEENFTQTSSGRVIKRSRATKSASGRRIVEKGRESGHKTRSGRVWKSSSSGAADQYYGYQTGYYSSSSSRRDRDYDYDYNYDNDRYGYDRGGYYSSSRGLGPGDTEKPQAGNLDLGTLKKKHKKIGWCFGCLGWLFGRRRRRQQQKQQQQLEQWQQQQQQQQHPQKQQPPPPQQEQQQQQQQEQQK